MKSIWKIYDHNKKEILSTKSYKSKEEAEEGKQKIIRVRMAARQSYDLEVIESDYIVSHNNIDDLQCDLERLEHFKLENNNEKVQEYLELMFSHVKDLLKKE